jgi:hypothetical protein
MSAEITTGLFKAEGISRASFWDALLVTVSYESHKLIDPAASENETRHQLKRRAFDHLLSVALRRSASLGQACNHAISSTFNLATDSSGEYSENIIQFIMFSVKKTYHGCLRINSQISFHG